MSETKVITEKIIDEAIAAAKAGHVNGLTYNQSSWCGTACCVLGFARHIAGLPEANSGPQDKEFAESPRISTIRSLMRCGSATILYIMAAVTPEGKIVLRDADLSGSNLSFSNLSGSDLRNSDLSFSDLRGSNLSGSNLSGSNLSGSNLRFSDLRNSDLRGSNLRDSDLRCAYRWDSEQSESVPVTDEWIRAQGGVR